ncbi:MAG: D-aminoacylase [Planctomycetia bacterium]|nr:D-aminoacylase [Planctomycetia bacterium]
MYDILITGGRIIDGTGAPWCYADLGIRAGRIDAIGRLAHLPARERINAGGKVVAPGLIDAHVHGDLALFTDPLHEPAIRQGVTTYIIGQDGVAMAPASPPTLEYMCRYTAGFSGGREWLSRPIKSWTTIDEYLRCFDRASAVNVATLVPNGNVRLEAMGLLTRPPHPDEIRTMRRLVRDGMEQGAVGLSSGLDYIPSRYAAEEELSALCEEIAPFGGVYVTHMRRYDPDGVTISMDEVYNIGRSAGCGVHISHFNSRADLVIPKLDAGRADGVDVTFDLYCYLAGSSILGMYCLPAWVQEGGIAATVTRLKDGSIGPRLREWFESPSLALETVRLSYVSAPEWKRYEGMTLPQAAGESRAAMGEFVRQILIASDMAAGCVVPHRNRCEADVTALIQHFCMLGGSDGIYTGSRPHPRGCGCYARYLGHYVRNGTWTLETAIQRLSGTTARRFSLKDRGLLREGMAADVIIFDPKVIGDRAVYDDGAALAVGMEHVVVNGEIVLHNGMRTSATPGRGLRRS